MRCIKLKIIYKNNKLQRICENFGDAKRAYNQEMAERIHLRISDIKSSSSIEEMVQHRIGRCHALKGDKKGLFAMDLVHPWRLILSREDDDTCCAKIEKIEDYH